MHDELQVKTVIWLGFGGGGGGKVGFRSEFVRRFHLNGSVCEGLIKVIVVSTVHSLRSGQRSVPLSAQSHTHAACSLESQI